MKVPIKYYIRTDYPKDTGFDRKKYSVIGVWVDPKTYQRMTCGRISYYGCDSMREAKSVMKQLAEENKTEEVAA